MRVSIVTMIIGGSYLDRWKTRCERGWRRYADKHGFDLIVVDTPLDRTSRAAARSPAWQKCLVLGPGVAGRYDRVIWIDSDILINASSPSVLDGVPPEMVGATDEHTFPSPEERRQIFTLLMQSAQRVNSPAAKTWQTYLDPADWHASWGLPRRGRSIVQTGVMALTPSRHRGLLEHVYYSYEDRGGEQMNYEMRPLSFEIQESKLLHALDNRFNALLIFLTIKRQMQLGRALTPPECGALVKSAFDQSYFLHLAGLKDSMDEYLPQLADADAGPSPLTNTRIP